MKQLIAGLVICGSAFVTGGCAGSGANADPNAVPKIDQDTRVYTTGSRLGRPDKAYEAQQQQGQQAQPAQPAAPAQQSTPTAK